MTTLIALSLMLNGDGPFNCPVMGGNATGKVVYYAGFKTKMCCGGCDTTFAKDPVKYLNAAAAKPNAVAAEFTYDPISHDAPKNAEINSTYKGVRYIFDSAANKATFDKAPAKYAVSFKVKEALVCPLTGEAIADSHAAAGYVDYKGARYFACCGGCLPKMLKDPAAAAAKVAAKVGEAKAEPAK